MGATVHVASAADRWGLDRRFWLISALATAAALAILAIPTAVIPNPFFVRMTPTEPFSIATLVLSAPLIGFVTATYLAPRVDRVTSESGTSRVGAAGIAAYLAIGCPICNKIIVGLLGVTGALELFAPLQPLLGAGAVATLAATLVWRFRVRASECVVCTTG